MYVDEGVAAPDGNEYTIEAFKAYLAGPARTPSVGDLMVAAFKGRWQMWRIRVRPWPRKLLEDRGWTTLVASEEDAMLLTERLRELVERGLWRPQDGQPPAGPRIR